MVKKESQMVEVGVVGGQGECSEHRDVAGLQPPAGIDLLNLARAGSRDAQKSHR